LLDLAGEIGGGAFVGVEEEDPRVFEGDGGEGGVAMGGIIVEGAGVDVGSGGSSDLQCGVGRLGIEDVDVVGPAMAFIFMVSDIYHSPWPRTSEKMSPFASTRATWAKSEFSTRIASFVRRSQRNWQERRFPCETSFACATNVDANSARSSTIGNKWSIPYCN